MLARGIWIFQFFNPQFFNFFSQFPWTLFRPIVTINGFGQAGFSVSGPAIGLAKRVTRWTIKPRTRSNTKRWNPTP